MPTRANPPADPATAEAIGEIRGQMRELIHSVNNQGQRGEANARILAKLEGVPAELSEIKERLTALETEQHRREGASGLIHAVLKSPALGWIVGAATTVWAFVTGRLQL